MRQAETQGVTVPTLMQQFGLELGEVHKQLQDTFGLAGDAVFVQTVAGGSEGARAGLKSNDILLALNEKPVRGIHGLQTLFAKMGARTEIRFTILRHGVHRTLLLSATEREATILERQRLNKALIAAQDAEGSAKQETAMAEESAEQARQEAGDSATLIKQLESTAYEALSLGLRVEPITPQLASMLGRANVNGIFISSVVVKSPAYDAGIRQNDLLVAVDEYLLHSPEDLHRWLAQKAPSPPMRLRLERSGKTLSVRLLTKESMQLAQERERLVVLQDVSIAQSQQATRQRMSSEQASKRVTDIETQLIRLDPTTRSALASNHLEEVAAVTTAVPSNKSAERRLHLAGRYQSGPAVLGPGMEYSLHLAAHVEVGNLVLITALEAAISPGAVERGILGAGLGFNQSIGPDWSVMASAELGAALVHLSDSMASTDFSVPTVRADITVFNDEWISGWRVAAGLGVRAMLVRADGKETLTSAPDIHMGLVW